MSFSESSREEIIAEDDFVRKMVGLLAEHYRPKRIYVFGSRARGDFNADSDYDFLVIVDKHPSFTEEKSFAKKRWAADLNKPADVVFWTEKGFEQRKLWKSSLPSVVHEEGIVVYEAA